MVNPGGNEELWKPNAITDGPIDRRCGNREQSRCRERAKRAPGHGENPPQEDPGRRGFRRNPLRLALVSSQRTGSAGEKRENSSTPRRRPQRFAFRSWGGSASLARSRGCLQRGGGTT